VSIIPEYKRGLARIDSLLEILKENHEDDLLSNAVASHICVLQSGTLENLFKETMTAFIEKRCAPQVRNYSVKRLNELQNPNPEKIEKLFQDFDVDMLQMLKDAWESNGIREHVSSVVSNRHNISHGRQTNVSPVRVQEWQTSLKKLAGFMEAFAR
jgi:hypothetical protein